MCLVRGEPGVAKNPAEQEEHGALGPRSGCGCQMAVWAGGVLRLFAGLGEELGTASGIAAGALSFTLQALENAVVS